MNIVLHIRIASPQLRQAEHAFQKQCAMSLRGQNTPLPEPSPFSSLYFLVEAQDWLHTQASPAFQLNLNYPSPLQLPALCARVCACVCRSTKRHHSSTACLCRGLFVCVSHCPKHTQAPNLAAWCWVNWVLQSWAEPSRAKPILALR